MRAHPRTLAENFKGGDSKRAESQTKSRRWLSKSAGCYRNTWGSTEGVHSRYGTSDLDEKLNQSIGRRGRREEGVNHAGEYFGNLHIGDEDDYGVQKDNKRKGSESEDSDSSGDGGAKCSSDELSDPDGNYKSHRRYLLEKRQQRDKEDERERVRKWQTT